MNNIKNMYILSYTHLQKSKYKKYFSSVTEYKIIVNTTDLKVQKELDKLNSLKRSNFWIISRKFDFKKLSDKKDFINCYINNYKNNTELQKYKDFYLYICNEVL